MLLDLMQGLAMTFVVIGHHLFTFLPSWYKGLHYYIYLFHMPFFIFISAFLIRYSYKGVDGIRGYCRYVSRKAVKFIPPYIIIGLLCILLKRPQSIDAIAEQSLCLLVNPLDSEATFLWYIYLLFQLYIISPIVISLPSWCKYALLAVCLTIWLFPAQTSLFCASYLCKLSPFYLAGIIVADTLKPRLQTLGEDTNATSHSHTFWGVAALTFFVGLSIAHFTIGYNPVLEHLLPWVAIPALTYLAYTSSHFSLAKAALIHISVNCFGIYLLHMFFVQGLALAASKTDAVGTTSGAIVYIAVSTTLSITLASFFWRRAKILLAKSQNRKNLGDFHCN